MLNFLGFAIFGLIVGAIARLLVPGRQNMGILMTMIMGIIGSLLGGAVGYFILGGGDGFSPAGWIGSIIGTTALIWFTTRRGRINA